ncbi:MAG: hypothetical protein WDO56_21800 [Gammaproteobacteria bacterium]
MRIVDMYWLPVSAEIGPRLRTLATEPAPDWAELVKLANTRLDFLQTNRLDKAIQRSVVTDAGVKTLKLAVLSSSTADHLLPACRVAAARRNFRLQTFVGDYGMYLQELQDDSAPVHAFAPDVMLFAFHAQHLFGAGDPTLSQADADAQVEAVVDRIEHVWSLARRTFRGQIIQQTIVSPDRPLMGSNEYRLPGSIVTLVERVNARLREKADAHRVDILALDWMAAGDGTRAWHDPVLWHRAKQEVSPLARPRIR